MSYLFFGAVGHAIPCCRPTPNTHIFGPLLSLISRPYGSITTDGKLLHSLCAAEHDLAPKHRGVWMHSHTSGEGTNPTGWVWSKTTVLMLADLDIACLCKCLHKTAC